MPLLQNPSLGQVTYVLQFKQPQEKIRFSQGDAEVAFGSFGAGQSQQTNIPDGADSSLPRIIFLRDKRSIAISQLAVQFSETFEAGDLAAQFDSVMAQIASFHKQALEYKQPKEYGSLGIVLQVNYPSEASQEQLHEYVYKKFVALPKIGELASIQLTLGFKIDDLFLNLGASVYEIRQFDVNVPGVPAKIMVDAGKAKLIGKGVQFTVDINDRPFRLKHPTADIDGANAILDTAKAFVTDELPKIVGAS